MFLLIVFCEYPFLSGIAVIGFPKGNQLSANSGKVR
jgi:hypothetical protein